MIGEDRFLVVHVATPIEVCRQRDTKGQYAKADSGELINFPGVTADYQVPAAADVTVDASTSSIDECCEAILECLREKGFIK